MKSTLEGKFEEALEDWKKHIRNNSFSSNPNDYVNCNAYREIVSIGHEVFPLVRDQLGQEIEAEQRYEAELKGLKIKVFGTPDVRLFDENYHKISEDQGYIDYEKRRSEETDGSPRHFWAYLVHQIAEDDFRIEVKQDSPVKPVAKGLVGIDVREVMKFTYEWLEQNS